MRILFTGVGRRIELLQAFRNAALVLNKDIKLYGADMSRLAPALAFCDYTRKVVSMNDPTYIDNLLSICIEDHIDLVIPTIDTDLIKLSKSKAFFENRGIKVLISAPEMIGICRDKNKTSQFFIKCGLHAPLPVNDWMKYQFGFPAFIKPKDGSSSINAYRVDSEDELKTYASQIKDYIVQPFIDGTEYTIDIFCDWHGKPISIVPRERVQVRAGEVLVTRISMDEKLIEGARSICEEFKPCGPITVQVIRDKNDIDWYIEINPRYGGGVPLSMKAGARSAEALIKLLDGEDIPESTNKVNVADGAVYSRFDQSVCTREGNRKLRGVIFDLDDTLYSEKDYVKSGFKAVSNYLNGNYREKLWRYFEDGKPAIDELLMFLKRESEREQVLEIYRTHRPEIHLYEGVAELIEQLKAHGIMVGIITDGRSVGQQNKIDALGLDKLVNDIIITDELGGVQFRKPCDIAFRIMQKKWRLDSSEIAYVGDNIVKDFIAPIQLGMYSICFKNVEGLYYTQNNKQNIVVANSVEKLREILVQQETSYEKSSMN